MTDILPIFSVELISFHSVFCDAAVQEERQRNREREGELDFGIGVNDEMPVEKILEAETAVEQKTELHSDGGSAGDSVSGWIICVSILATGAFSFFLSQT